LDRELTESGNRTKLQGDLAGNVSVNMCLILNSYHDSAM